MGRKRERPLSSSRLSPRKLHIMVRRGACAWFGQLPKSDGCTERNNGVARPLARTCPHCESSTRGHIPARAYIYRRHYRHVHAALLSLAWPFRFRSLARTRAPHGFCVSRARTDCPAKRICRFCGFICINAHIRTRKRMARHRARSRARRTKIIRIIERIVRARSVCRAENDATVRYGKRKSLIEDTITS